MTQFESMVAIDKSEELAMAGDSEAAYSLARLFDLGERGERVERDDANAILWFTDFGIANCYFQDPGQSTTAV